MQNLVFPVQEEADSIISLSDGLPRFLNVIENLHELLVSLPGKMHSASAAFCEGNIHPGTAQGIPLLEYIKMILHLAFRALEAENA